MKVFAINGSPRNNGNTAALLNTVIHVLNKEGIDTELMHMAGQQVRGCQGCYKCYKNKNQRCSMEDDIINSILSKMLEADGILLGSPTYFSDVSSSMRTVIERCGFVARANKNMLRRKVGAGVVAMRRSGGTVAFNSMNLFLLEMQMIIPGSSTFNIGLGINPGDATKDAEGIQSMELLGSNMSWLMKKLFKGDA